MRTDQGLPDPLDPHSFTHKSLRVPTSGHTYHYVDQRPPPNAPVVKTPSDLEPVILCLHGFPELWYSYRYQIVGLARLGWRVIVPSMLGYGDSSKPDSLEAYSIEPLSRDLEELLIEIGIKRKVIVLCHDWGSFLGWRFAQFYPDRVKALISVCVPFQPPTKKPYMPFKKVVEMLPNFGYQLFFAEDRSTEIIDANLEALIIPMASQQIRDAMWAAIDEKGYDPEKAWVRGDRFEKALLSLKTTERGRELSRILLAAIEDDPAATYFYETFKRTGIRGGLMWYRTRELNHEQSKRLPQGFPAHIPAILFSPTRDDALPIELSLMSASSFERHGGSIEVQIVEGADHWALDDVKWRDHLTKRIGEFVQDACDGRTEARLRGKKVKVIKWGRDGKEVEDEAERAGGRERQSKL